MLNLSCKKEQSLQDINNDSQSVINIRQDFCYMRLPLSVNAITVRQSSMTLVKPHTLRLDVDQSEIKIVEEGSNYQYVFDLKQSRIDGTLNSESASSQVITVTGTQSSVERYEY